jgi:hypothetical protein
MDKDLIPIGEAAEILGVSINTLRNWDDNGRLPSLRDTPTGHRRYSKKAIEVYLNDLLKLATDWISTGVEIPSGDYCDNSALFQARLQKMQNLLAQSMNEEIQKIFPLVVAVAGEIGNNSFDHNLGQWPDIAGIFFGYDLNKRQVVLADRGQGILQTLKRIRPNLVDDKNALEVAFTEIISGREPEERGNGLKFVRNVVVGNFIGLYFQSGSAELELKRDSSDLHLKQAPNYYRGCIALISY